MYNDESADNDILELERNEEEELANNNKHDWMTLGINAYIHEAYDEAIAFFDQAIDKDPTNAKAYVNRGDVYHDKGEYEEALNDYKMAAHLGSKEAIAIHDEYILELQSLKILTKDGFLKK